MSATRTLWLNFFRSYIKLKLKFAYTLVFTQCEKNKDVCRFELQSDVASKQIKPRGSSCAHIKELEIFFLTINNKIKIG